jgi:RHS repeat-associated protein
VGELRYYAYGKTRYNSGSTPTSYRFTGQREDATIGLYFYNARYYDAALGRFVQADSMVPEPGNPQSLNRYSYVLNSPLNYTDPSGHRECGPACQGDFTDFRLDTCQGMECFGYWHLPPQPTPSPSLYKEPGCATIDEEMSTTFGNVAFVADGIGWGFSVPGAIMEGVGGLEAAAVYAGTLEWVDKGSAVVSLETTVLADYYGGYTCIDNVNTLGEFPEIVIGQDTAVDVTANTFNLLWPEAIGDTLVNTAEMAFESYSFFYPTISNAVHGEPTWEIRLTVSGVYQVHYVDGHQVYVSVFGPSVGTVIVK